ncbi:MAG: hypothetical protein A2V66_14185 [Ignavibacteria bacterium RBG_13_36_8]|nr:MAG: hypothetical protein A2V66_14185 [Ignavibacteria bacterium RBG_13_36_8]
MKKIFVVVLLFTTSLCYAQFKEELKKPVNILNGIVNNSPSSFILGFIDPNNLQIRHSVDMSFMASGKNSIALGVYTGSLSYKFNEKFNLRLDASIINSPYNSLGKEFTNRINGLYLSRAQLNYKPSDNFFISIEYRQIPAGYYTPYYNNSPFYMLGIDEGISFDK